MVLLLISIFNIVSLKNIFHVKADKIRMLPETDKMSMGLLLLLVGHSSDIDVKKHILTIKRSIKESIASLNLK